MSHAKRESPVPCRPGLATRRLGYLPLLAALYACGFNPSHKVRLDGGDAMDAHPAPSDGFGDGAVDSMRRVDATPDAPATFVDTGGPVDTLTGIDTTALVDATAVPDATVVPDTRSLPDLPADLAARDSGPTADGPPGVGGMDAGGLNMDASLAVDSAVIAIDAAVGTGGVVGSGGTTATGGVTASGGTLVGTGGSATGGSATGGVPSTGGTTQTGVWADCTLSLHMDEAAWNGTTGEVTDSSGAGNHGTAIANTTTTNLPAKIGRAGAFDGSGYVSVPDSATLHAGSSFSVAAWVYPTALNGSAAPGIVSKRIGYGNGTEFAVFIWTGNRVFVDVDGETDRFESLAVLNNNTWYHVAVVFDGSADPSQRVRLYINGQLDTVHAETSSTVTPSNAQVMVGNLPDGGNRFTGSIDEVAFWRRPLSAAEILNLYQ